MIQIIIDQNIYLETSLDQEVNIVFENPFFSIGEIPAPYSLDLELPNTLHNSTEIKNLTKDSVVEVFYNNYMVFKGSVTSRGKTPESISINLLGANLPISLNEDLREFDLGKDVVHIGYQNENNRRKAQISANSDIIYIPHYKSGDTGLVEDKNDFSWVYSKYLNWYDIEKSTFFTPSGTQNVLSGLVSPTIKLSRLLNHILPNSYGFFDNLDLYVAGHVAKLIRFKNSSSETEDVVFNNFFKEFSAEDFVASAMNLFCVACYASGDKFVFKSRKQILEDTPLYDWSTKIDNNYSITSEVSQSYAAYFSNGNFNSPTNKTIIEHPSLYQLENHVNSLPDSHTGQSHYMVGRDIYLWSDKTLSYVGIESSTKGVEDAEISASVEFAPASVYVGKNGAGIESTSSGQWSGHILPNYFSSHIGDTPIIGYLANSLLYRKLCIYLTTHNKNIRGDITIADDIMSLEKTSPFYRKWHKGYENLLNREQEILSLNVALSAKELSELDLSKKVFSGNSEYLIKTLDVTFFHKGLNNADVELLKLN